MRSRQERLRSRIAFEALEGRLALSGLGGIDDGPGHHQGRDAAEVRYGANDPAGHDANDDHGHHGHGADDPAGHR
jgi:hypothetical protein